MFWIKFFTMVKALIGYRWAFWRANNWPWPWPCTTELERLPFVHKNREFRLEIQMAQLIPPESVRKRWNPQTYSLFPFQPEWTENRCIICPVHLGAFSCLLLQIHRPFWNFRQTTRHFSLRSQNSEYPRLLNFQPRIMHFPYFAWFTQSRLSAHIP